MVSHVPKLYSLGVSLLTLDEVHEHVKRGHVVAVSLFVALGCLSLASTLTILGHLLSV